MDVDLLGCCLGGDDVSDDECKATWDMFEVEPLARDHLTSTPLFDAILQNEWEAVDFFLESGSFSFSPFQSYDHEGTQADAAEDQVETWIVCENDEGTLLWRQLPIHAAICYGAPLHTVKELVKSYPAGLCCADTGGNLPLHLAVKFNRPEDILGLLFTSFPEAYHAENGRGQRPLECADGIEDAEGKERFNLLQTFEGCQKYLAIKAAREKKKELDDVTKRAKEASAQLVKAQRELGLWKRFPIRRIVSQKQQLIPWRKSSKGQLRNE